MSDGRSLHPDHEEFRENRARVQALVDELRARINAVTAGGGPALIERHVAQGKLFVRERIEKLLDADSPFLELSPLAAWAAALPS